ncbi:MAG TPA: histidine kinase [Candidatus Binatia bacterium]|nr:histidine kinase [Candidatus Binatia bacterium]
MQWPSLRGVARAYLMSIGFWCGMALLMTLQYKPLDLKHFWPSVVDLVLQTGIHAFALALWTPPIFYLAASYFGFAKRRVRYVLLWALGAVPFLLLHISFFWLLSPSYDNSLHRYVWSASSWLEMVRTSFADDTFVYIAIVVAAHGYEYLKRLRREERELYEYRQALAASEPQALKMQLQPHFLFNTLHGIATLADTDPRTAKAMIIKLSNLLRTALDRDNSDLIPLESELKFASEYLDIEKMRFGPRMRVEWKISSEARNALVPQMILQPLIENAVRHGIASSREPGWIEISASESDGALNLQVCNSTGSETSNGSGVGLRNVEARLKHLYSADASFHLTIADRTAVANLSLPAWNSGHGAKTADLQPQEHKDPLCEFSSSMTNP